MLEMVCRLAKTCCSLVLGIPVKQAIARAYSCQGSLPHMLRTVLQVPATTLCHSPDHALATSKYICRTFAMTLCLHKRWLH